MSESTAVLRIPIKFQTVTLPTAELYRHSSLRSGSQQFDHLWPGGGAVDDGDRALLRAFLCRRECHADGALRARSNACATSRRDAELGAGFHRRDSQRLAAGICEADHLRRAGRAAGLLFEIQRRREREDDYARVEQRPDVTVD